MLIFLYGQDTYRLQQKIKEIIEQYKKIHKSELNLARLSGQDIKFDDFKNIFQQVSMFGEKKLIILSDFFPNQELKENILKKAGFFSESKDIFLLYEKDKIAKNDNFLKALKKPAKIQEFRPLEGEKLKNWARKEFRELNAQISPQALDKMVDSIGNNLWRFSSEIKKTVNYKKGKKINLEDVGLMVRPKIETAIFKTIDAIAQRNKKKALLLVHRHLDKGESPLYLLSMVNFQFRNILSVKDLIEKNVPYYSISKKTGLHPFVAKKSFEQAGKFTFQELKKIYWKIFQADLDIKTGRINPETALDLLIAEI